MAIKSPIAFISSLHILQGKNKKKKNKMGVVIKCDVRLPKKPQSEDLFGHLNSYQPDPIKPYSAFMVSQSKFLKFKLKLLSDYRAQKEFFRRMNCRLLWASSIP